MRKGTFYMKNVNNTLKKIERWREIDIKKQNLIIGKNNIRKNVYGYDIFLLYNKKKYILYMNMMFLCYIIKKKKHL